MEFFKNQVVFEEVPQKLVDLLIEIVQREEKPIDEITQSIDKKNLYAEVGGEGKTNYISIGFFESYDRNDVTDIVAFCPQIKISHKPEKNEIIVYFYKESHPILLKKAKITIGESKIVEIDQDELRYVLNEAHKLNFIGD